MAFTMKILFYAINHVGLGHVVRLSVLQRFITQRNAADCYFFSESRYAGSYFSCPGMLVNGTSWSPSQRWELLVEGVRRAMDEIQPDILVCDTYWAEAAACIPILQRRGGRAVLVLRMTDKLLMERRVHAARSVFDAILLPHHPDEVRWTYRKDPMLLRQLDSPQHVMIGPICRTARRPSRNNEVIFTVGAGGEWPGVSKANQM